MTGFSAPDKSDIAGYDFGSANSARSPVSAEELLQLEQTLGWTTNDAQLLRKHAPLFAAQAEKMVDSWRAIIGTQPHLAKWFLAPNGKPDDEYKAAVKKRFVQWVKDVAIRPHDQAWLDYQEEIGLRHTPDKKNRTDRHQRPPLVPLRYLLAFVPVVTPGSPLFRRCHYRPHGTRRDRARMDQSSPSSRELWTRPYSRDGLW